MVVDLTAEKFRVEEIGKEYCKKYVGGLGFVARFLFDYTSARIDPLSPENVLIFATGPFSGTLVPCGDKHATGAKSPLTGFIGESRALYSSFWSRELKRTGHDALIIKGKAKKPSYLFIEDGEVQFEDAKNIWGKDCFETSQLIREDLGDELVKVSSIGPAGENLVSIASISNERRDDCRTGLGAVMGSKRLKAIALRGTKTVDVSNIDELAKISADLYEKAQGPATSKYRILGTSANVLIFNSIANLPTRNWQQSTFEKAEEVSGECILENYVTNIFACSSCPIACDHNAAVKEGTYAGTATSVDYESLWALGPLCGISNFPTIAKAMQLCDSYGLDTISTGGVIAWAMECHDKGMLNEKDFGGLKPSFGSEEALIQLIHRIARREGIGDLLAQGSRKASEKIGKDSEHFAMHIKGLEMPGFDIRGLKTAALGWAVAAQGGSQNRSWAYEADLNNEVNRFKAETGRGRIVAESEDRAAIFDSLMLCKFLRGCFKDFYTEAAQIYKLVTGIEMSAKELRRAGERIVNVKKAYNVREGWTRSDDHLPARIMKDPIPDQAAKGSLVNQQELDLLLDDYYAVRGWTKDGQAPKRHLTELQLDDLAEETGD